MKKIHLVTGGSGFVGLNIVKLLVKMKCKVRVFDLVKDSEMPKEVEFLFGDINKKSDLLKALDGISYVHHNIALVPLAKAGNNFWKVNVEGTRLLLNLAKEKKVEFFSHMSSSAVFGSPNKMPIDNTTECKPIEIYGRAKLAGENLVINEIKKGFKAAIIRPRTVIGNNRLGIFQILFEWISEGKNIYIIGKGNTLFQFVHVEDLAMISILSCLKRKEGIFNVGTNEFGTLREDLEYLCKYANNKSKVKSLPVWASILFLKILDKLKLSPLGPWHYMTYHKPFYFDSTPVYNKFDWYPKWSNREMLIESYDWFVKNYNSKDTTTNGSLHKKPVQQKFIKLLKYLQL